MAAKRIAKHSVDWARMAELCPPHQKTQLQSFKSKSDAYLRKVLALPEKPPAIDWSYYQKYVPVAGMVDDFQKQYSALNIPYPKDTVSHNIDAFEKEIKADIAKFKAESEARIEKYKKELAHLASLIPINEMTMEDFKDAYPELALDPLNKPTFWPHTPEEQPGYKPDDAHRSKH